MRVGSSRSRVVSRGERREMIGPRELRARWALRGLTFLLAAAAALMTLWVCAGLASAERSARSGAGGSVAGLPAGAAAAALVPEPSLTVPTGWRFPDAFSRTSGTGRRIDGALEWSDWVDDAWG